MRQKSYCSKTKAPHFLTFCGIGKGKFFTRQSDHQLAGVTGFYRPMAYSILFEGAKTIDDNSGRIKFEQGSSLQSLGQCK